MLGEEIGEIEEIHLEWEKDHFEDKISLYEASQMLMDYENTDKEFFCEASIVRVNHGKDGKGWYYIDCKKYKRQVQNKDGQTTFPRCKQNFDGEVLPWYRITVRIKDNTEYADLTIFGFNVEKMLKYTAAEHVAYAERCEKMGEPEKATQVFDRIIGEKFGFKLKMTEDNIEKQSDSYTILKIHTIVKKNNISNEQLGPKTPQKDKQQKVRLLEDKTRQIEKQQKRKRLRRMVIEEDLDEEEDDEDENAMVEKSKTTTEQKTKRLRRMVVEKEDDEDARKEDKMEGDLDEEEDDEDENDENAMVKKNDEDEKEGAGDENGDEGDEDE
ncbi:glutamic acid-rich protein-like [Papaver somniferum]|uniref:glutamic acid-rich protein-like n=1 Tax=Papaver somniferum TaxID=3469 RepID=UPI000E6F63DB|nr:glutamic acid-rich protein-like [Papaver somniferum]XP_026416636.1 glutamic acid-rich protein-like [Papaver somniferum]